MTLEGAEHAEAPAIDRLEALYVRYCDAATRFAFLLTGSAEEAQDVVHDSFLRVFARFGDLRRPDSFGAYLRRTVLNQVQMRQRARKTAAANLHKLVSDRQEDPTEAIASRNDIAAALALLPVRQRAALVLRYVDDMSEAQVADVMSCSVAAVKSLVTRAADALRETLGGNRDGL